MSKYFDNTIYMCIVINTLVLTVRWYGNPDSVENVTSIINIAFVVVFSLEAFIKIIAFGLRYFRDNWNNFDLAVVIISIVGSIL